MRALGPGSVSSFLKIILDVVFAALWIALGAVALVLLATLLFSFNPDLLPAVLTANVATVARRGPLLAGALLGFGLSIGGVLVIVHSLRQIFVTLTAGDPFHPYNVRRLRLIGLMLAVRQPLHALGEGRPARLQPHLLVFRPGGLRAGRGVP
jgi:hypothetical protein